MCREAGQVAPSLADLDIAFDVATMDDEDANGCVNLRQFVHLYAQVLRICSTVATPRTHAWQRLALHAQSRNSRVHKRSDNNLTPICMHAWRTHREEKNEILSLSWAQRKTRNPSRVFKCLLRLTSLQYVISRLITSLPFFFKPSQVKKGEVAGLGGGTAISGALGVLTTGWHTRTGAGEQNSDYDLIPDHMDGFREALKDHMNGEVKSSFLFSSMFYFLFSSSSSIVVVTIT